MESIYDNLLSLMTIEMALRTDNRNKTVGDTVKLMDGSGMISPDGKKRYIVDKDIAGHRSGIG